LNAGAAIYAANLTDDLGGGVQQAQEILKSAAAIEKLDELSKFTQAFS
jgi:anthranilate phosphoribosyltransferase